MQTVVDVLPILREAKLSFDTDKWAEKVRHNKRQKLISGKVLKNVKGEELTVINQVEAM